MNKLAKHTNGADLGALDEVNMTGEKVRGLLVVAALQPVFYFVFETIGVGFNLCFRIGDYDRLNPYGCSCFC